MVIWHGELGKKKTGGKIHEHRKKRKYELGSMAVHTRLGVTKVRYHRMKGGNIKLKAASVEFANLLNTATKEMKKVKILDVKSNPANPHYVRRKIVTKGAVIETEAGLARVTSRPSQDGVVNAVTLTTEEKKR
jgi:small subunit ribosomal protein S8e